MGDGSRNCSCKQGRWQTPVVSGKVVHRRKDKVCFPLGPPLMQLVPITSHGSAPTAVEPRACQGAQCSRGWGSFSNSHMMCGGCVLVQCFITTGSSFL